jgi:hypothetical protein
MESLAFDFLKYKNNINYRRQFLTQCTKEQKIALSGLNEAYNRVFPDYVKIQGKTYGDKKNQQKEFELKTKLETIRLKMYSLFQS